MLKIFGGLLKALLDAQPGPLEGVRIRVIIHEPHPTILGRKLTEELALLGAYADIGEEQPKSGYILSVSLFGGGISSDHQPAKLRIFWRLLDERRELVQSGDLEEIVRESLAGPAMARAARNISEKIDFHWAAPVPA